MIAKAKYLQFLTAGTCVSATAGGVYYCFNERKEKGVDIGVLMASTNSETQKQPFSEFFDIEPYNKLELKNKIDKFINLVKDLNGNIDKPITKNLSNHSGDNGDGDTDSDDEEGDDDSEQSKSDEDAGDNSEDEKETITPEKLETFVEELSSFFTTENSDESKELEKIKKSLKPLKALLQKLNQPK